MQGQVIGADVWLAGVLDVRSVAAAREELTQALARSDGALLVDVSAVEAIDAAGLGMLVALHRRARRLGRRVVLREPQPAVRRVLARTRLHRILPVQRASA